MSRHHQISCQILAPLAAVGMLLVAGPAGAQAVEAFYKGKVIRIVVGFSAGGGSDMNARLLARFIGRYIPGNPAVVVENMPGASSLKSVLYLDNAAPKDGTVIAAFNPGLVTESLTKPDQIAINLTKYSWLGSVSQEIRVCYLRADLGINSFQDLIRHSPINFGETGRGSASYVDSGILKEIFGVKVKSILGYPGGNERHMAVERGELDGECTSFSSVPIEWVRNGKATIILRESTVLLPGLPASVPYIMDLTDNPASRKVIELLYSPSYLGRPYIMSKAVPADRLAVLRKAFDAAIKDTQLIAEAQRLQLPIVGPLPGEAADAYVEKLYKAPLDVVAAARKITE